MSREVLKDDQIRDALSELPGWTFEKDRLNKTFEFRDFKEAMGFIVRLAFHAEEQNHHPELTNTYNRVSVSLCTHDAGDKVTDADVRLARAIQRFVWV